MADVLQLAGQLGTYMSVPLIGHLITDAPHHHTRIVAEMMHQIHQILFHPILEILMVSVLHLGCLPLIEGFQHQHHTHLVADTHQLGRRHVVRSSDGITAHILHDSDLTAKCRFVCSRSQRSEIMMVADSLKLQRFAIQEKSLVRNNLQRTDSERSLILVLQFAAFVDFRHSRVEHRSFGRPQLRIGYNQFLLKGVSTGKYTIGTSFTLVGSNHLTCCILNFGNNSIIV